MEAVTALAPGAGVMAAACAAVGLARATFHRHRHAAKQLSLPARPKTKPARTLTAGERQGVLDLLREQRFEGKRSPATLLPHWL